MKEQKVHSDTYCYNNVLYANTDTQIEIICRIHGSFFQTPHSHMRGKNCKKCSVIEGAKYTKTKIEDFINIANKVYNNKYNYSKSIYVNTNTKLIVICPIHGEFETNPHHHLNGKSGCPTCKHKQEG